MAMVLQMDRFLFLINVADEDELASLAQGSVLLEAVQG